MAPGVRTVDASNATHLGTSHVFHPRIGSSDAEFRSGIGDLLRRSGVDVVAAEDAGTRFVEGSIEREADLAVLDKRLMDIAGAELCLVVAELERPARRVVRTSGRPARPGIESFDTSGIGWERRLLLAAGIRREDDPRPCVRGRRSRAGPPRGGATRAGGGPTRAGRTGHDG